MAEGSGDNVIRINIPNVLTIGIIGLVFFAVIGAIGAGARAATSAA